jgi:biotin carboxylase
MRVLLLDTNVSSYPIYESLIEDGYEVFVAGSNQNDCLALVSENYIQFDYSNFDELKKQVKTNNIEIVLPGCNDVSYSMASLFNEEFNTNLNIESPSVDYLLNNKDAFKQFAIETGLKVPKKIKVDEILTSNFLPIIIKPTDSFSGKGVTVIDFYDKKTIESAISLAISNSKSQGYVIEDFVRGQLYSHSCFIIDGKIQQDFIVEEHCIHYPFAVDKSWVIENTECAFLGLIRMEINKILNKLHLKDGVFHTQFIFDGKDISILEVTRRCPGDLYSKLIEYSTGINYASIYVNLILEIKNDFKNSVIKNKIIRETIHKSIKHYFSLNLEKYKSIKEFVPIIKSGEENLYTSRLGILFFTSNF